VVIGWGNDLLGNWPFAALGFVIFGNNFIFAAAISTVLLALLYSRVQSWGLLYYQILDEAPDEFSDELSAQVGLDAGAISIASCPKPTRAFRKIAFAGAIVCIVGSAVAFAAGFLISAGILHAGFGAMAFGSKAAAGTAALALSMAPGMLMMLIGAALL